MKQLFSPFITLIFVISGSVTSLSASAALGQGAKGTGTIQSAIPIEHKMLNVSVGFEHASGTDLGVKNMNGVVATTDHSTSSEAIRQTSYAALTYGLFTFLETGLYVPYYRDNLLGNEETGIGNVKTSFKFNYPPYPHKGGFELSYLLQLDFPTGGEEYPKGFNRHGWYATDSNTTPYGNSNVVTTLKLLTTANFGAIEGMFPLHLHLNWGLVLGAADASNVLLLDAGVDVNIKKYVSLFWSAETEVFVDHATKEIPITDYPIVHSAGIEAHVPDINLTFTAGAKFGTNMQDSSYYLINGESVGYSVVPEMSIFGGVSFGISFLPKDSDGDGVLDKVDSCPRDKEDFDGFEDGDGCPETDNDGDGVPDQNDKCPLKAEDRDGFKDEDGCLDADNDFDTILDDDDKCPNEPEDGDSFEDEDGCPEFDNDKDGILDLADKCPLEAEDRDDYEDGDGCPDMDNDKDGVPDAVDKCPNKAEIVNGYLDGDGCPDEEPKFKMKKKKKKKRTRRKRR
ncbi:MAG: thrombospondin type 3 repeat-containing protein [Fibrobacterales bacterium]